MRIIFGLGLKRKPTPYLIRLWLVEIREFVITKVKFSSGMMARDFLVNAGAGIYVSGWNTLQWAIRNFRKSNRLNHPDRRQNGNPEAIAWTLYSSKKKYHCTRTAYMRKGELVYFIKTNAVNSCTLRTINKQVGENFPGFFITRDKR